MTEALKVYQEEDLTIALNDHAKKSLTKKYSHIDIQDVKNYLIEEKNMTFHSSSVASVRKEENKGYQKHVMIFNTGFKIDEGNEIQLLVTNAYDGTTSLKFNLGIYRAVCANGLVVGDDLYFQRICHKSITIEDVEEVIEKVYMQLPIIASKTTDLMDKKIDFKGKEAQKYIKDSVKFMYGDRNFLFNEIVPRRIEDSEQTLYNLFNMTQEHIMKALIQYEVPGKASNDNSIRKVRVKTQIEKVRRSNQFMFDEILKLAA